MMVIEALSNIVGAVSAQVASHRPKSLCTAFGVNKSGILEFHLLNEDTGEAIVISELEFPTRADALVDDMKTAIYQHSTTKSKPEAV